MYDSNLLNYSLINILRTGNIMIDTILAMILPLFLTTIYKFINNYYPIIIDYLNFRFSKEYCRKITFIEENNEYNSECSGIRNNILQKALIMYTAEIYKINNMKANIELRAIKENGTRNNYYCGITYGDTSKQLKDYKIYTTPPEKYWIKIDKYIYIYLDNDYINLENKRLRKTIISLKCRHSNGNQLLSEFINMSFRWYINKMESMEDKSRYMFMPVNNRRESRNIKYKRYLLNDNKSFASLFFDKKTHLINIIDNFINKNDKYKIDGYPYKLSILLNGIPGSGKTSLIKAISSYTKRHIIYVDISKISTNQDLMNIMNDQSFLPENDEISVQIPFESCIFVFEDIDAATDIVKSRKIQNKNNKTVTQHVINIGDAEPINDTNDKLNLAGILNCFDGITSNYGRMSIMTTNHIEKIDPALLRPGRVDYIYHLNYINFNNAVKLIQHYFMQELDVKQLNNLEKIFYNNIENTEYNNINISPATLECLCSEFDNIDNLICAIKDRFIS